MIVPTMSFDEISEYLTRVAKKYMPYFERQLISKHREYKQFVKNARNNNDKKALFFTPFIKEVEPGLSIIAAPFVNKNYPPSSPQYVGASVFFFFRYKENELMGALPDANLKPVFFKSHLLERYQTRFLNAVNNDEKDYSKQELFTKIVKSIISSQVNDGMLFSPQPNTIPAVTEKYGENSMVVETADGLLLGKLEGNSCVLYTFVSKDLLFSDEEELMQKNRDVDDSRVRDIYLSIMSAFNPKSKKDLENILIRNHCSPVDIYALCLIYEREHQKPVEAKPSKEVNLNQSVIAFLSSSPNKEEYQKRLEMTRNSLKLTSLEVYQLHNHIITINPNLAESRRTSKTIIISENQLRRLFK